MTSVRPVLRALPYYPRETMIHLHGERIIVRAFQIVVWVSIAHVGDDESPRTNPFPAILDTGHNDNFVISPRHLREWAGMAWQDLPIEPGVERRYQGVAVPYRRANLWLHPNQYGWRDLIDPGLQPALLELDAGIAVFGDGERVGVEETRSLIAPRLPLLGLRALTLSQARLRIAADESAVWLDLPGQDK